MEQYHGINCPICGKPLEDGREISVCPECGAPYHKECIQKRGSCCFPELHRLHENWQPDGSASGSSRSSSSSEETCRCPNCGKENPISGVFCVNCGAPLQSDASRQYRQRYYQQNGGYGSGSPFEQGSEGGYQGSPFGQPGMGQGPGGMGGFGPAGQSGGFGPNVYSPFAGMNPEEKLDDIAVTDYALFVGQNTHYFLPRFKLMAEGKKVLPNFSAFLFSGFYFLYRKMVLWGILLLCMNVLLYLPSVMLMVNAVQYAINPEAALMFNPDVVSSMSMVASFISVALNVVLCLFTNRLYYAFTRKKINGIKAKESDISRHSQLIQKRGGVLKVLIPILLVAYFVLYIGIQYMVLNLAG